MADLKCSIAGIKSPNPFWLASAPPTNSGDQVKRAFDTGWGGAVWKTLGDPIINVSSRLGGIVYKSQRLMGLNNIELITDRPLDINLKEIRDVKKQYSQHALIVSLMVESKRESWHEMVKKIEDTGCDGLELNFGCPHGMSERGMGSAVGQVPEYTKMVTEWVKEVAQTPILVKLTPNITDVTYPAKAAQDGGADAVSLINTINSIIGVNLDNFAPIPEVNGKSTHGGYCGPAVKPIALNMVSSIARREDIIIPISGIGGISTWQDATEFILLGSSTVQICTAVMHYGYRIVEDLIDGLSNYMDEKGFKAVAEMVGHSIQNIDIWGNLDLNYKVVAKIDTTKCIGCKLCYIACLDGAHQCIHLDKTNNSRIPWVDETECVGCNLCALVCPVKDCIAMVRVDDGTNPLSWKQYIELKTKNPSISPPGMPGY